MLIKEAKIYILQEEPRVREITSRYRMLEKVPPALTGRYTRATMMHAQDESIVISYKSDGPVPTYRSIIRLITDGDLSAYTDQAVLRLLPPPGFDRDELVWQAWWFKTAIAPNLIGIDALDREAVWEKLCFGQRFNYTGRAVLDTVDRMLWDLAARHAGKPIYQILGGSREKIPAYYDIIGNTMDELLADAVSAKNMGYKGIKDHSYRGVKFNIELARELRAAMGPEMGLMHDCVWNYTYEDAVKVGRELERQNYTWMEEPLMDFDWMGIKKLADTLDVPILGQEWSPALGGQPFCEAWFLASHAVDIVRGRGLGITGHLKLSEACQSFGIPVHGLDHNVALATGVDLWCEWGHGVPALDGSEHNVRGVPVVEDGYMHLAWEDRVPQEPDWDEIEKKAVVVV